MFIGSLTETDVDHTGSIPGIGPRQEDQPGGCRKMLNDAENTGSISWLLQRRLLDEEVNLSEANIHGDAAEALPLTDASRFYLSDVGGQAINKHFPLICKSQ